MSENTHATAAERIYSLCETGQGMDAAQQSAGAAMAQAQATLALAYEQRTANLIALFCEENIADLNYGNLLLQIKERLALN